MEFRLLVPIIPLFYLVIIKWLSEIYNRHKLIFYAVATLLFLFAPIFHHFSEYYIYRPAVATVAASGKTIEGKYGWKTVGEELKRILPADTKIAVVPAGAIPYYSELYSLDMLGLNDRYITQHGHKLTTTANGIKPNPKFGVRQGHVLIGDYDYAAQKEVNFIILLPIIIEKGSADFMSSRVLDGTRRTSSWRDFLLNTWRETDSLTFVLLPIKDRYLVSIYCRGNDRLDKVISHNKCPLFAVYRDEWSRPFLTKHN